MTGFGGKTLVPVICLLVVASIVVSSGGSLLAATYTWTPVATGATLSLDDVSALSTSQVWTVGEGGKIYYYNGTSWASQVSGTAENLHSVFALNATNVWAVGDSATIIHYNGTAWSSQASAGLNTFWDVYAIAANNAWVVGTAGQIFHYNGTNWVSEGAFGNQLSGVYAVSASNIWAVGSSGTIRHSNGSTWSDVASGTVTDLWRVDGIADNKIWAVGEDGVVRYYNGSSWVGQSSGITGDLYDVSAVDANNVWAAGYEGSSPTVLRYNGSAWSAERLGTVSSTIFYGIFALDTSHAWAAGDAATLLYRQGASVKDTWYLAEGTNAWGFDTYISIMNPNSSAVTADVTYMPTGKANVTEAVNLPAMSQTTLTGDHLVSKMGGNYDFSTKVVGRGGKTIAVDRTMSWTGPGAASPEGHSSVGVNAPAKTWYLPEGSTNWGFETWLLIQNPNGSKANCLVTYMLEGEDPVTVPHSVDANSRASFSMETDIGKKDASIKVVPDKPVIPERAMYRNNRREGHDSIGTTAPATNYYLAEGTSAWGFTTYVLVQNPNTSAIDVTITYMTGDGPKPQALFPMPANSRKTVRVNDVLPNTDFSTKVHGSKPIIAERAMYWDNGTGEACHDSIGMSAPAMTFYLPDGQTSGGRETWTLVQNPNGSAVEVTISYLTPDGSGNVTFPATIPANSRQTFNMVEKGIEGRAAVLVASKPGGLPIMVERAMYWNSRGAGTDTIGGSAE